MTSPSLLSVDKESPAELWPDALYPDESWLSRLNLSEYETSFFRGEYERGLEYYLNRIDRLMLSGERVLDAGCGVGQWSLALSRRFNRVDAVDVNAGRLDTFQSVIQHTGAANIQVQIASITALPFEDNSFDAIFCYGVIMFTPLQESLREFYRVLKPGGRLYICLNGPGWYQMILDTRDDKALQKYMRHILAKTVLEQAGWILTPESYQAHQCAFQSLDQLVRSRGRDLWKLYAKLPYADQWLAKSIQKKPALYNLLQPYLVRTGPSGLLHVSRQLLQDIPNFSKSDSHRLFWRLIMIFNLPVLGECISVNKQAQDLLRYDLDPERLGDSTRAYEPLEFGTFLSEAGLTDYQHAPESRIVCDFSTPEPEPIYAGVYQGKLAVWECLATKPICQPDLMTPDDHYREAEAARNAYTLLTETPVPVLSNLSQASFTFDLGHRAQARARVLGGPLHLQALVDSLVANTTNDEQRFMAIVEFVQRSLFHHPLIQPMAASGALLEDATTILMTHIGRCGHAARLVTEMLALGGFPAEIVQLRNHVTAKAWVNGRWLLAEADIFKNGVFPLNASGSLLSFDDIRENPYRLDCYAPTGWFVRPGTRFTKDCWGQEVRGYVDVFPFESRGFVSGYFEPSAAGYPPSLPQIEQFTVRNNTFELCWKPAEARHQDLLGYRVSVGTKSRQWDYDTPGSQDEILRGTSTDILYVETSNCSVTGSVSPGTTALYASVTAFSRRIEIEPDTFFWPSQEISWQQES